MIKKLIIQYQTIICRIILCAVKDVCLKMDVEGWLAFLKGSRIVADKYKEFYKANYFMSLCLIEKAFIKKILNYLLRNKYLALIKAGRMKIIDLTTKGLDFLENESATIDFLKEIIC